ncbi:MAG: DNA-processing protein DprA [Armatimonadota bacterium]
MRTLLTVALRSHLIGDPPPVSAKVWRVLRAAVSKCAGPDALMHWASRSLLPDDGDRVKARLDLLSQVEGKLAELVEQGVRAVSEFDPEYPQRFHETLGEKKPEVLFVSGELSLLNWRSIGVVGSRDADAPARQFAQAVAEVAVGAGYSVVSGAAKGIDQVAMNAAYEAGGRSLGFLAESLLSRVRQEAEVMDEGLVCLATCYKPDSAFSVGNAMGRNKLIYGHADATVVVSAARGSGGTWAGATEACASGHTVLVRSGPGVPDGNVGLLEGGSLFGGGARPLERPEHLLDLLSELDAQSAGA